MSKDPLTTLEADSITLKSVDTKWRRHTRAIERAHPLSVSEFVIGQQRAWE